jgi:ABC-type antimicrobial peptide transport system permease subunit
MKLGDLTELATRNLREALLRNSLTTLGIAIGVASLVAMLSLGVGLQDLVGRRLERTGLFNSVLVRSQGGFGGAPNNQNNQNRRNGDNANNGDNGENGENNAPPPPIKPLDEAVRQQFAKLPKVVEVYPEFRFAADARLDAAGHLAQVASLPASASSSDAFEDMQGHFFSAPDAREVILQSDLARQLADTQNLRPADLLGKQIVLRYAGRQPLPASSAGDELSPDEAALGFSIISLQAPMRVVGIITDDATFGGPGGLGRAGAYIPLAVAQGLGVVQGNDMTEIIRDSSANGGDHYASLTVRVDRPTDVQQVEQAIQQMGYSVFSLLDLTQNLRRVFAVLDLLLGIFGSLALAVASLGIVNTLAMSILERRREIGVLKALGASDRDVRQLFFAEAGVMGLTGGVAGVVFGWSIGRIIQFVTEIYLRRQSIPAENIWSVPWWLVGGAIGFSILVSLVAGMYPASHAAHLDPVEALRYD